MAENQCCGNCKHWQPLEMYVNGETGKCVFMPANELPSSLIRRPMHQRFGRECPCHEQSCEPPESPNSPEGRE
jgi:hypothetical protein